MRLVTDLVHRAPTRPRDKERRVPNAVVVNCTAVVDLRRGRVGERRRDTQVVQFISPLVSAGTLPSVVPGRRGVDRPARTLVPDRPALTRHQGLLPCLVTSVFSPYSRPPTGSTSS